MTRETIKRLTVFIVVVLFPAVVFARKLPADLTELSLEDLMNVDISVSTASKYEQKATEAPSSVTVITSDEIKKYNYRTLAEILQSVGGFYTTYDRNYTYLGVRGFSRAGDYNSRILFLVNGHRMNETADDYAGIGTDFIIDVDLIERVEIVRGPSFSLYGNNAFFGTVNVITRTAGNALENAEVSGTAAGNRTYNGRITLSHEFSNYSSIILSGSKYDNRGNARLYYEEFNDPATNNGIARSMDNDNNYSFYLNALFRDFTFEGAYISREKTIPTAAWGTIFNDPRTGSNDHRAYADLKFEHEFDGQISATARLSYDYYTYQGNYAYDYPPITVNRDFTYSEWIGGEFNLLKKLFDKHIVIFGMSYTYNIHNDQRNYDEYPYVEYLNDKRNPWVWAVYAQDEFKIKDGLILNVGVRHDHYSTFGGTTNPRIALIYRPVDTTGLKFIYGSAFRAPNGYELYYNDGFSTMKNNPHLRSETIRDYEVILDHSFGEHLNSSITGFYYISRDLIGETVDTNDGLMVYKNLDTDKANGLELEVQGKWSGGLQGRLSYSYTKAQDKKTGALLTDSPEQLAKFNLILPMIKERLFFGLEEQYTAERKTLAGNTAGDYMVTNITLFSQDQIKGLEASVGVYNLLNKRYSDPGSSDGLPDLIAQDGRTFRLKLTYSF